MSIKKIYSQRKRNGYVFDSKKGAYYSWQIDLYLQDGTRHREKGFRTKDDAESAIAAIRVREKSGKHGILQTAKVVTLKELFERRLPTIENKQEFVRARRVFDYFLQLLPSGFLVTELASPHLREYITARQLDKVQPQTIDRELNTLAACLHRAAEFAPELESWQCPRIPRPKIKERRRERVISESEKQLLLDDLLDPNKRAGENEIKLEARLTAGAILQFALLTGLRHGEICALRWTDLDEQARSLRVVRTKTDSVSYISPLSDKMLEILRRRREVSAGDFIFSKSGKNPNTMYRLLKKACARCGVPYGRDNPDGVILHDARHTFTTRLLQAGVDVATIQSFTGHNTKEMVMRYSHAGAESRARAMQVIDGHNNGQKLNHRKLREIFDSVRSGEMSFEEFSDFLLKI